MVALNKSCSIFDITIMHSEFVTEAWFVWPLKTYCFYCQNNNNIKQKSILGDS